MSFGLFGRVAELSIALAAVGCSGAEPPVRVLDGGPSKATPDARAASSDSRASEPDETACTIPDHHEAADAQDFSRLEAHVIDQDGRAVTDVAEVCGLDLCLSAETDSRGHVVVAEAHSMERPAFRYGNGIAHSTIAALLDPDDGPSYDLADIVAIRLPKTGARRIAPGSITRAGPIEIEVDEGSYVKIDRLTYTDEGDRGLRALLVPKDRAPGVASGFDLVLAIAPERTLVCPPATLRVKNEPGWRPGTRAAIFLHGVDVDETWAPYGGWAEQSKARVTEDGAWIETEQGISVLGLLGIRKEP